MEFRFKNTECPLVFVEWVIKNLKISFSRDNIIQACELNIRDHPEQEQLFRNFIEEMYFFSHHQVYVYYHNMRVRMLKES